jgi:cell wall-associated NlpC family hydrolase
MQHPGDRNPPRGELVFWSWMGTVDGVTRNWGHVGISLGGGRAISTAWYGRGVHEFSIASTPGGYAGWIPAV